MWDPCSFEIPEVLMVAERPARDVAGGIALDDIQNTGGPLKLECPYDYMVAYVRVRAVAGTERLSTCQT